MYYKLILLKVGTYETSIVDERHFADRETAERYAKEHTPDDSTVSVLVEMMNRKE